MGRHGTATYVLRISKKRRREMKIKRITDEAIVFNNGNRISFDHWQHGCEYNYADFKQLNDTSVFDIEFNEDLVFELVEGIGYKDIGAGFKFGNPENMFFVPCHSSQNGHYTTNIQIYYEKCVLDMYCELDA